MATYKEFFIKLYFKIKQGNKGERRGRGTDEANSNVRIENIWHNVSILTKDQPTFASELPSSQGKEENMISDSIQSIQKTWLLSQEAHS